MNPIKKILLTLGVLLLMRVASRAQFIGVGIQGGYGWLTTPVLGKEIDNTVNNFIHSSSSGSTSVSSNGAYNVGVHLKLAKFLIGAIGVFETTNSTKNFTNNGSSGYVSTKNKYETYMGRLQWNYFGALIVHLYGSLAGGVSMVKSTVTSLNNDSGSKVGDQSSSNVFAYQITPIGISVGNKISAFGEVGYGWLGLFNVGVRLTL